MRDIDENLPTETLHLESLESHLHSSEIAASSQRVPSADAATKAARTINRRRVNPRASVSAFIPSHTTRSLMEDTSNEPEPELKAEISVIDYGPDHFSHETDIKSMKSRILLQGRPPWAKVRWINVDGIDEYVIKTLTSRYRIHPLVATDLLHTSTRPKIDIFENECQIFVVAKMVTLARNPMKIEEEQTCFFMDSERCTVITFQEGRPGDVWEDLRKRLAKPNTKVRLSGVDHLLYCLMEAIPRTCYPIITEITDRMEYLEENLVGKLTPEMNKEMYSLKRELMTLRRSIWPMRELVAQIIGDEMPGDMVNTDSKMFFKDICDELNQISDMVEGQVEIAVGFSTMYTEAQQHRVQQAMYVLTITSVIFIPLTFFAAIYGMNFEDLPELRWKFGYLYFWSVIIGLTCGLLYIFRRKKFI